MDEVTWGALTLTLTLLGGAWTWYAFRHRGLASGLRGAGLTLLPLSLYLTDTLQMVSKIASAVSFWALHLAFSPTVWAGLMVGGLGVVLLTVSGYLRNRELGAASDAPPGRTARDATALGPARRVRSKPVVDPEMAEIEAILRKRGIT